MTSTRTVNAGKIGFTWKGTYAVNTAYTVWDTFLYNNSVYLCTADATAGTDPENTTYFTCLSRGFVFRGSYDDTATYYRNNFVESNNLVWCCIEDGVTGTFDSSKWKTFPSYRRNISFSIGNNYACTEETDTNLVALWNLIDGSSMSVNGSQTAYGMTLNSAGTPIVMLSPEAPVIDAFATYQKDTTTPFTRFPQATIPDLALSDGDAITVSILRWAGTSAGNSGIQYLSYGISGDTSLSAGEYGLCIEDTGNRIYVKLKYISSGTNVTQASLIASDSNNNMFITNALNDITVTIQRSGTNYVCNLFVNGTLIKTQTTANANDVNFTKAWIGAVTSDNQWTVSYDRGIAQIAVYSGVKYTANYTPTYALLKKTV